MILLFKWFYVFIERRAQNFILKFREIFSLRETVLGATEWNLMNSRFSVKFMKFFDENGTCCDWQEFFFISEGFWRFFLSQGALNFHMIFYLTLFTLQFNISKSSVDIAVKAGARNSLCKLTTLPISIWSFISFCLHYSLTSLNLAWTKLSKQALETLSVSLPPCLEKLNLSGCKTTIEDMSK